MLGYIVLKVSFSSWTTPNFSLQLSRRTKHQRLFRKTSAYRSRSPAWCDSRPSSQGWAWPRGWPWWVSAAGCTADTAGGSSWDTTPHLSHTLQQVIKSRANHKNTANKDQLLVAILLLFVFMRCLMNAFDCIFIYRKATRRLRFTFV